MVKIYIGLTKAAVLSMLCVPAPETVEITVEFGGNGCSHKTDVNYGQCRGAERDALRLARQLAEFWRRSRFMGKAATCKMLVGNCILFQGQWRFGNEHKYCVQPVERS